MHANGHLGRLSLVHVCLSESRAVSSSSSGSTLEEQEEEEEEDFFCCRTVSCTVEIHSPARGTIKTNGSEEEDGDEVEA